MVEMEDLFLIFHGSYLSRSLHKQNSFTPRKCRRHHFYIHCYISSCLQSVLHKIKKFFILKSSCEIICNIGKFVFERIVQAQLKLYGNQLQLTFAPVGKSWLFWHQNADKGFNQYTSQKEPKTKFDW